MDKLHVIKVGGAVVENPDALESLLDAFVSVKGAKVLVHGGGREATRIAGKLGIETIMVNGRRVTDASMLDVVTMVYAGKVNKNIVAGLLKRNVKAVGLSGADAACMTSLKRAAGEVDYGFVGDIEHVDGEALSIFIDNGMVPVMIPITCDENGQLLNTNADSVAGAVAVELAKRYDVTLVSCFEKAGVLSDPDDDSSVIPSIDRASFRKLVENGTVGGGMLPKLENAFAALDGGVSEVLITCSDNLGKEGCGTSVRL